MSQAELENTGWSATTQIEIGSEGKKFLVLFLSITNNTSEDDYINYNYISAKVNGKDIEHTFLVND
ncbi:MAG: hypothetical protein K1W19_07625, partial [Lachnospiraceae bacterium]